MKWFLILWACPVAALAAWYWLSYNDISFGIYMLTRQTHDLVFEVYGGILGVSPESLPPLVARAIAVDSLVVLAIIAVRKRRQIAAWWRGRQSAARARAESLSNAP